MRSFAPRFQLVGSFDIIRTCLLLQERQDYLAAEGHRKDTESAHELVTDIEGMLRRISARGALAAGKRAEQEEEEQAGEKGTTRVEVSEECNQARHYPAEDSDDGEARGDCRCETGTGSNLANLEAALKAAASACELPGKLRACNSKLRSLLQSQPATL